MKVIQEERVSLGRVGYHCIYELAAHGRGHIVLQPHSASRDVERTYDAEA